MASAKDVIFNTLVFSHVFTILPTIWGYHQFQHWILEKIIFFHSASQINIHTYTNNNTLSYCSLFWSQKVNWTALTWSKKNNKLGLFQRSFGSPKPYIQPKTVSFKILLPRFSSKSRFLCTVQTCCSLNMAISLFSNKSKLCSSTVTKFYCTCPKKMTS